MGYFKIKIAVTFEGRKTLQRDQCSANLWHLNFCTALVPLQSFSSFKSYSDFNLKIAQKWEILRENNVIFQFSKNWNIYLSMSCLSFFHLFSDFLLKNRAKFDTFSLIFEFQPPLLIRFSDTEILIVRTKLNNNKQISSCLMSFPNFIAFFLFMWPYLKFVIVYSIFLACKMTFWKKGVIFKKKSTKPKLRSW